MEYYRYIIIGELVIIALLAFIGSELHEIKKYLNKLALRLGSANENNNF